MMTADDVYAKLVTSIEAAQSYRGGEPHILETITQPLALASIALELREWRLASAKRPVVHESTEPAVPSSMPPDDFEPQDRSSHCTCGHEQIQHKGSLLFPTACSGKRLRDNSQHCPCLAFTAAGRPSIWAGLETHGKGGPIGG